MRTFITLGLLALLTSAASAREVEPGIANTSLSSAPVRTTSASRDHVKREPIAPAKYDVVYPVHDVGRAIHSRGSI